jgi:hypothetical protein
VLINESYKFVFVHIPKCAGISVRQCLQRIDGSDGSFFGVKNHPELGDLDVTHIPLAILREYFKIEFEKIRTYDSFAVIRDPYQRFPSSMFQYLKMYGGGSTGALTKRECAKKVDEAIAFLSHSRNAEILPYSYIHFQKQHTFVMDSDAQIVGRLFTLDKLSVLFDHVSNLIGQNVLPPVDLGGPHENKSELFKSRFLGSLAVYLLPIYKRTLKSWAPDKLQNSLKSLLLTGQAQKYKDVFESKHVRQFVADYYLQDVELFNRVESQPSSITP